MDPVRHYRCVYLGRITAGPRDLPPFSDWQKTGESTNFKSYRMDRTKKFGISAGIIATGVLCEVLFPNSAAGATILTVCIVVGLMLPPLLDSLSAAEQTMRNPTAKSPAPNPQSASRADVVDRYLRSIRAGDSGELENKVRDCLREIAACENWLGQAPSEWERLRQWRRLVSPELRGLALMLEEQFLKRQQELAQLKLEQDTDRLWHAHLPIINKFFEIAERKVSILDDYGDERWDVLPREISACLLKISTAEGRPLSYQDLRTLRKYGHGLSLPENYRSLATRLEAAFREYHAASRSDMPDQRLKDLSGSEFEVHVAHVLKANGYDVRGTPVTGDQGADLIASKAGKTVVVQAKCYNGAVGNKAVQEVVAAINFYDASEGWVITNSVFTPAAKALAQKNNVRLVDGSELARLEKAMQASGSNTSSE